MFDRSPLATHHAALNPRRGFTLVELLVAVAIIIILIGITVVAVGTLGDSAKEAATVATISKIHRQLEQRLEAFDRKMTEIENSSQKPSDYQARKRSVRQQLAAQGVFPTDEQLRILVRKDLMRSNFPQNYDETNRSNPSGPSAADSAELLYFILTEADIGGAPTVDAGEFQASAIGDTDDDGLPEFLDGWGRPLRFYRWPTELYHNDEQAELLIDAFPSDHHSDPDDPLGRLQPLIQQMGADAFEQLYHTPETAYAPLVVSAGADGVLGLTEPHQGLGLAAPSGNLDALTDNITNRNRRVGEN